MSATKIILQRNLQDAWLQGRATPLVRHLVEPRPGFRCPECRSIIYARRHRLCGVCGTELPQAVLFSAVECARVEAVLKLERERHRQWMHKPD
jgi:hypothetical protein